VEHTKSIGRTSTTYSQKPTQSVCPATTVYTADRPTASRIQLSIWRNESVFCGV